MQSPVTPHGWEWVVPLQILLAVKRGLVELSAFKQVRVRRGDGGRTSDPYIELAESRIDQFGPVLLPGMKDPSATFPIGRCPLLGFSADVARHPGCVLASASACLYGRGFGRGGRASAGEVARNSAVSRIALLTEVILPFEEFALVESPLASVVVVRAQIADGEAFDGQIDRSVVHSHDIVALSHGRFPAFRQGECGRADAIGLPIPLAWVPVYCGEHGLDAALGEHQCLHFAVGRTVRSRDRASVLRANVDVALRASGRIGGCGRCRDVATDNGAIRLAVADVTPENHVPHNPILTGSDTVR